MIPKTRAFFPIKLALFAVCLLCALLAPAAVMAAEGAVHYEKESLQQYEKQLAGGQVASAEFNKKVRSLHLTLKDGRHVLVKYAAHGSEALEKQLRAKNVPVTVKTAAEANKEAKKPVKHKLRYIVGGILVVVVVVVGGVLLIDRRRKTAAE
jgi:hypothetical protein